LQTDIRNAGGEWRDEEVVVSDEGPFTLVTSRNPDDLPAFCERLIALLAAHDPTRKAERPGRLEEMLERKDLSDDAKRKILQEWERDAHALSRAESEGMSGGVEGRLDEIQHTKRRLERGRSQPKPH
jgi:hypothetical protein